MSYETELTSQKYLENYLQDLSEWREYVKKSIIHLTDIEIGLMQDPGRKNKKFQHALIDENLRYFNRINSGLLVLKESDLTEEELRRKGYYKILSQLANGIIHQVEFARSDDGIDRSLYGNFNWEIGWPSKLGEELRFISSA